MAHLWVHSSFNAPMPPMAVIGGHDIDQAPIFVGRALCEGDNIPAKVIPGKGTFVCWGGREIAVQRFEVLTGQGYGWVPAAKGVIPPMSVAGGNTMSGETLFIGRAHHEGSLCVGKIQPSHGCLYIPFGGKEVRKDHYEVLVEQNQQTQWVPTTAAYTPPDAVIAGHDFDRTTLYVGRALHEGEFLPAKVAPSKGTAFVCFQGFEVPKTNYEILTGVGFYWEKDHHHRVPPNAVSTGVSRNGEPLLVGRGEHMLSIMPGLISPSQKALFVPYGGREVRLHSYDYLCRN